MPNLATGLNEAGIHFLGIERDTLEEQMKSVRLSELKHAVSKIIGEFDINFQSEESKCFDCHATHDDRGRAHHARGCMFVTFEDFIKDPSKFGFVR